MRAPTRLNSDAHNRAMNSVPGFSRESSCGKPVGQNGVLTPPVLNRPLILYLTLTEYDIEYVPRTSVKGQAIADHLAEFPIDDDTPINTDFPDEGILQVDEEKEEPTWKIYFDGAVNSVGSEVGAVFIFPDGRHYPVAAKVDFSCTNNVAEYEACILGLQAAIDFKVKELEVFGDSMLTIFQTLGQWKTKDTKLVPYHEYLEELAKNFEKISFTNTPRAKNQFADALATLASMWIEAITLALVTAKAVARFLRRDVIARYGVPATIITDNAKNLNNKVIDELCAQFKIRHRNSTPYRPQMNGAVEAANKNIKKIIEKMTAKVRGQCRLNHVRRSRHSLFTTRRSRAVETPGSKGTRYT
ncbi:hypothetical protein CRG98_025125 [Punica granatum]|uniref:Uncharacterized protein n=1 Tax=Punica granatum TaxID=22663 RepID=A0A2I0JEQ8_PUNGR|nr:hypothetical protein CRG98_025125 [Punica granatum]